MLLLSIIVMSELGLLLLGTLSFKIKFYLFIKILKMVIWALYIKYLFNLRKY